MGHIKDLVSLGCIAWTMTACIYCTSPNKSLKDIKDLLPKFHYDVTIDYNKPSKK